MLNSGLLFDLLVLSFRVSMVLLVATGLVFLIRRGGPSLRHGIWVAAIVTVLLLPFFQNSIPAWKVIHAPEWVSQSSEANLPVGVVEQRVNGSDIAALDGRSLNSARTQPNPIRSVASSISAMVRGLALPQILLLVWGVGGLAVLLHAMIGYAGLFAISRRSTAVTDPATLYAFRSSRENLAVNRKIRLVVDSRLIIPMTWGVQNPTIFLPSSSKHWSADRKNCVLSHELAHVKRWDCLSQMLAQFVCAVFWFNPLAWYAVSRLRIERELVCDQMVVQSGVKPSVYADQLLSIAEGLKSRVDVPAGALAIARPNQLEERLTRLLSSSGNRANGRYSSGAGSRLERMHTSVQFCSVVLFILPLGLFCIHERTDGAQSLAEAELMSPYYYMSALQDAEIATRVDALYKLGRLQNPIAIGSIQKVLMHDSSEEVRIAAATALGKMGPNVCVSALEKGLYDSNKGVRRAVAKSLSEIEHRAL